MPPTLPLDVTIQSVTLDNFITSVPPPPTGLSGGAPAIIHFPGSPLYYRATANAVTGMIDVAIDQNPPNIVLSTPGQLGQITLTTEDLNNFQQTMMLDVTPMQVQYRGGELDLTLGFTSTTLDVATLHLAQPPMMGPSVNIPTIGMIVLNPPIASPPIAYFVNVPINDPNFRNYTTISVSWQRPGGMAGPIGGGTVP
jgi:hypothetical protein